MKHVPSPPKIATICGHTVNPRLLLRLLYYWNNRVGYYSISVRSSKDQQEREATVTPVNFSKSKLIVDLAMTWYFDIAHVCIRSSSIIYLLRRRILSHSMIHGSQRGGNKEKSGPEKNQKFPNATYIGNSRRFDGPLRAIFPYSIGVERDSSPLMRLGFGDSERSWAQQNFLFF